MVRVVLANQNQANAVTNNLRLDEDAFYLTLFPGVVTKNSCTAKLSNLETSNGKRVAPHKRPTAILLVNVWPILMQIKYDVKARGKTIGTLQRLVSYSESVSNTDRIIGLVWMHL